VLPCLGLISAAKPSRTLIGAEALVALLVACSGSGTHHTQTATSAGTSGSTTASTTGGSGTSGSTGASSSGGTSTSGSSSSGTTGGMPDAGCGCDAGTFCDPLGTSNCLACLTDHDCAPPKPVCQLASDQLSYGQCVGCDAAHPTCPAQQVCDLSLGATYQSCVPDCRLSDAGACLEDGGRPLYCSHLIGTCSPECTSDLDCPSATPRCRIATGRCVECLAPGDCPFTNPGCFANLHVCGGCDTVADCPAGMSCDPALGCTCTADPQCGGAAPVCVIGVGQDGGSCGCGNNVDCSLREAVCSPTGTAGICIPPCNDGGTDCSASSQFCDFDSGLCGPCSSDLQCIGNPEGPYCSVMCSCLMSSDCGPSLVCNPLSFPNQCVPSCAIDGGTDCSILAAQSPAYQFCDLDTGVCGTCDQDSQCVAVDAGVACIFGFCVQCLDAGQCPADHAGCNSQTLTCGSCFQSSDCPVYLPTCLNQVCATGCVLPDGGQHCQSGVCQTSTGYCVECLSDSDCSQPGSPRCTSDIDAGNACAQCVAASDCGDAGPCNGALFTCGTCASNADCPSAAPTCLNAPMGSCSDGGS
jgi:hypothetical protein